LAKLLGLTNNGGPLLTALLALWAGWRGWTAAVFWQTRACARTNWNRVAAGVALAIVITVVALGAMRLGFADSTAPQGLVEFVLAAGLFLIPMAVLAWFTRRRAFAKNDPACPWPPKKS
jgi:hypothetical protein